MDNSIRVLIDSLTNPEVVSAIHEKIIVPAIKEVLTAQEVRHQKETDFLRDLVYEQALKLNELEQYSKKNCLIISGMPESSDENVFGIVMEIGRLMGVEVLLRDMCNAHRLGKERADKGKPRPIIVKFVSFNKRSEFYAERKTIREVKVDDESCFDARALTNVYVSDCLTRHNSAVMYAARQLKRDHQITAQWCDAGKMKVRLTQDGRTQIIRGISDLRRLVGQHPCLEFDPLVDEEKPTDAGTASAEGGNKPRGGAGTGDSGERGTSTSSATADKHRNSASAVAGPRTRAGAASVATTRGSPRPGAAASAGSPHAPRPWPQSAGRRGGRR